MPPSTAQRQQIAAFQNVTGAAEKVATKMLKNSGWNMDVAVDQYFTQAGQSAPSKNNDTLVRLFESYRDSKSDPPDAFGITGILKYFGQLGVDPEDASALIALEITKAAGMEEVTKAGFVDGWKEIGAADTIEKQKQHVAHQTKLLKSDPVFFKRLYRWTFGFAKENNQKALMLDTAIVYWTVLFSPPGPSLKTDSTNWLNEWTGYLQEKWSKSVNKDMWNQTLEFFNKALADDRLSFWNEDGAWPGVIDDFVAHMKEKRGESPEKMEVD